MLARMWRKRNTPPLLVRLQDCTTTLEISLAVPQKTEHDTTRGYTILHYIHSSPIYNSQKLERIQMSLNGGMDTANVVYLHSGILLSN